MCLSQVRGSQILEAGRLHRLGFPESVPLNEFVRRFGLLNDTAMPKESNSVESILSFNEIDSSTYRIGPSQVSCTFFHSIIHVGIIFHCVVSIFNIRACSQTTLDVKRV